MFFKHIICFRRLNEMNEILSSVITDRHAVEEIPEDRSGARYFTPRRECNRRS